MASFEVVSRDDNRRITEIEENFLDPGAADDYRTERVTFTYGDGHVVAGERDSGAWTEFDKVYWSFLSGVALDTSDPNRLVQEVRTLVDEGYKGNYAVTYNKEYRYDPNGNRLALIERDSNDDITAMTRYNYLYEQVNCGGDAITEPPGTPDTGSAQWMDYDGLGRDQLLSTQKLTFKGEELSSVAVETFTYSQAHPHIQSRERTTYLFDEVEEAWWVRMVETTDYEYPVNAAIQIPLDRLQAVLYAYEVYEQGKEACAPGDVIDSGAVGERYAYDDLLGRRSATWTCQISGDTTIDWGPEGPCKARTRSFDYYGLSPRVAMVRSSPFFHVGCEQPEGESKQGDPPCSPYENSGHGFEESYTYGPVGVLVRSSEGGDADGGNNDHHYVLADLFGGTTGVLLDGGEGDRSPSFQHFDAFGVRAQTTGEWSESQELSRYRWRSQEGSETDDLSATPVEDVELTTPYLVYMQTRHYDPALGRFIMADSIPMGAFSPQGLNRYAYCTNDPISSTDSSGQLAQYVFGIAFSLAFLFGFTAGFYLGDLIRPSGPLANALYSLFGGGVGIFSCAILDKQMQVTTALAALLESIGALSAMSALGMMSDAFTRGMFLAFGLGLVLGFGLGLADAANSSQDWLGVPFRSEEDAIFPMRVLTLVERSSWNGPVPTRLVMRQCNANANSMPCRIHVGRRSFTEAI